MRVIKKIFLTLLLLSGILFCVALGYYFIVTKDVVLDKNKLIFNVKNVCVYNYDNALSTSVQLENLKQVVNIQSIPEHTRFAFVDAEDKRFFSHNGFDFRRIVKASLANLKSGSYKQGASTISQQLIKNTHLSHEKTLKRKLKEWKLTRKLEKAFSKNEILEKYLNSIYFGHNCFGIASASYFYFGKPTSELDVADSAILAGLLKSPNNYSPFKNPEKCQARKKSVLNAMKENGHISENTYLDAINKPLPKNFNTTKSNSGYAHFVFDELAELSETQRFTVGGKIEIYTYLNENLQAKLVSLFESYEDSDFFASILNGETGGFSACLSSVGNVKRLPGSLLKPLLVYAPAIEENFLSPATPILDERVDFSGYSPENFDKKFHGYVSARECLSKSLNVPAVKVLQSLGIEKGASYLEKLNLPVEKEDQSLALALGGMKHGYTMPNLLSAYSALQNQGEYTSGAFIKEIKIDGQTVYKRTPKKHKVFSKETAYLTTDMLKTAVQSGTAKKLRSFHSPIAVKTGTVGTDKGNTDAYGISYTVNDVIGVWLGNADNTFISQTGGGLPCNYLLKINEYLYEKPLKDFTIPDGVSTVELDKTYYYDTHTTVLADKNSPKEYRFPELFKNTNIPAKTSELFSNPTINTPILTFNGQSITITFDEKSPRFYQYKIVRYDYATHNTLYFGDFIKEFTDSRLEEDKTYIYTVYPVYNGTVGNEIALPSISTKKGENILNDKNILEKNWWEY